MFRAQLPLYWGDCIRTSTYLINPIPTTVLGYVSPYEKTLNKAHAYEYLKIFGCLAHMS